MVATSPSASLAFASGSTAIGSAIGFSASASAARIISEGMLALSSLLQQAALALAPMDAQMWEVPGKTKVSSQMLKEKVKGIPEFMINNNLRSEKQKCASPLTSSIAFFFWCP